MRGGGAGIRAGRKELVSWRHPLSSSTLSLQSELLNSEF
jgi:hypothetical protein